MNGVFVSKIGAAPPHARDEARLGGADSPREMRPRPCAQIKSATDHWT